MVRTEVALIAARNLARVDEVKICSQDCKAFCLECGEAFVVLVLIYQVVDDLELRFPGDGRRILVEHLLHKLPRAIGVAAGWEKQWCLRLYRALVLSVVLDRRWLIFNNRLFVLHCRRLTLSDRLARHVTQRVDLGWSIHVVPAIVLDHDTVAGKIL